MSCRRPCPRLETAWQVWQGPRETAQHLCRWTAHRLLKVFITCVLLFCSGFSGRGRGRAASAAPAAARTQGAPAHLPRAARVSDQHLPISAHHDECAAWKCGKEAKPQCRLQGRLTVVLDMDGTLVSSYTPARAPRLPAGMLSYIVGRGARINPKGVFVVERPGLREFFAKLSEFAGARACLARTACPQ